MSRYYPVSDDDQHQPLTWVQGRPLYATHVIVALLALTIVACAVLRSIGAEAVLLAMPFDGAAVLSGQAWRVLTYGLLNFPSVAIAIDLLLLFWFGREVEKFLGRRSFLRLYVFIYLIPPLVLSLIGIWWPLSHAGQTGALAVFVAFATLYPAATVVLNVLASWAAAILVAVYTLVALSYRDWASLVALWSTSAYAFAFIRHHQGHLSFSLPRVPSPFGRAPEPRERPAIMPSIRPSPNRPAPAASRPAALDEMAEVDALLDKIGRTGLQSLTPRELERLAAAQARIARRLDRPTV